MTKHKIEQEYFEWMYGLICNVKYSKNLSYRKLMHYLYQIDFTYIIDMDENRAEDGVDLRYRFGYEQKLDKQLIEEYLDDCPCSVLEMLIALSIRCEEHIMDNPDAGNRIGQWFWNMIVNLGLGSMNDSKFNERYADKIISRFLNREYKPNGEGGLFTLKQCRTDLRTGEIWYQLCWYLDENI